MSFDTNQTDKLKQFLQANQPLVPPPSPQLETRLLARINISFQGGGLWFQPTWPWLTGGLVAIAVVVGGGIHWRQTQMAQTPDMEVLEAFLQETWTGTMEDGYSWTDATMPEDASTPTQEWWLLTDPPPP